MVTLLWSSSSRCYDEAKTRFNHYKSCIISKFDLKIMEVNVIDYNLNCIISVSECATTTASVNLFRIISLLVWNISREECAQ